MAQQKLHINNNEHGRRIIHQETKKYDGLIPPPNLGDEVISDDIIAQKTVGFMWEIINKTLWQTEKLAQELKGKTARETFRNVWVFLHDNIQFRLDDGEELRNPSRTWKDRKEGVDCDCFTIFACSILINLGYKPIIRIGGYADSGGGYSHVYTVMLGTENIVIDPVLHHFNLEKTTKIKRDFMNTTTRYLSGLGSSDGEYSSELGAAHAAATEPILQNLLATKENLLNHPEVFDAAGMEAGDSHELVVMIENLVRVYGTPEFDALIVQYESNLQETVSGLGAAAKPKAKVKLNFIQGIKNAVKTVKTATIEAIKNPKQALKNIAAAGVKALHVINRVNPLIAASRGLLILAMQHNLFNLAVLFLDHLNRNTSFGQSIAKIWNVGGGKIENLKEACIKGANRKLNGMGFIGATVATTAGVPAMTMLMEMVHKGVKEGVIKVGKEGIEAVTKTAINMTMKPTSGATKSATPSTRPTSPASKGAPLTTRPATKTPPPKTPTKKMNGLGEGGEDSIDTGDSEINLGESDASFQSAEDKAAEIANPALIEEKQSFFKKMRVWISVAFEKLGIKSAIKGAAEVVATNAVDRTFNTDGSANDALPMTEDSNGSVFEKDTDKPADKKSNTMLYAGGAVAVLVVLIVAYKATQGSEESVSAKPLSGAMSYPDSDFISLK